MIVSMTRFYFQTNGHILQISLSALSVRIILPQLSSHVWCDCMQACPSLALIARTSSMSSSEVSFLSGLSIAGGLFTFPVTILVTQNCHLLSHSRGGMLKKHSLMFYVPGSILFN